jgi:plastocyanin
MIKHIGLSMALCVMIMGTGCAGTDTTPKNTVSDVTGGTVITIEDFSFSPKTITVSPGEVVTVVNKDIAGHSVTSDKGGVFDTNIISSGKTVTFTAPQESGSHGYHCTPHPSMQGTLVVE